MNKSLNQKTKRLFSTSIEKYIDTEWPMGKKNLIRFDGGEFHNTSFAQLTKLLASITKDDITKYSDPRGNALKKQIAMFEQIEPQNISLGSGADAIIENIPRIFLNPKETVVIPVPTFFRFIDASLKEESNIITVLLKKIDNFEFTDKIANKVINQANKSNAKIIWLCSPNNPTGRIIPIALIEKILSNTESIVVVDETLSEFATDFVSAKNLLNHSNKLIVLKSLSKVLGLPGVRVGWAISSPEITHILENFRLPYEISNVSKSIAIQALKYNHVNRIQLHNKEELEKLICSIKPLKNLDFISESNANTLLIRHKRLDLFKALLDNNVLTADFRMANGIENMGFVRITLQNRSKNEHLIKILNKINFTETQ